MKIVKKNYWLLGVAVVPLVSLYFQQVTPQFINSSQMIFASINLACAVSIIISSVRTIVKRKESMYFIDKVILGFGFVYIIMILLLVCSAILSVF
jgi:hypothetical protein